MIIELSPVIHLGRNSDYRDFCQDIMILYAMVIVYLLDNEEAFIGEFLEKLYLSGLWWITTIVFILTVLSVFILSGLWWTIPILGILIVLTIIIELLPSC